MTDKEKLLAGLKLIQEACHDKEIVENFNIFNCAKIPHFPDSQVSFMLAEGYEKEPITINFDEEGNFLKRV